VKSPEFKPQYHQDKGGRKEEREGRREGGKKRKISLPVLFSKYSFPFPGNN
jgi:hypothetical protein